MWPLGVVDAVERVDLGLQLIERLGERLLVEVAEQGLVEVFVLALGGRFVRLAGDRFHAQARHVLDELAEESAPRGVERDAVVGQQSLGHSVGADGLVHYGDCGLGGLAPRDVGTQRRSGSDRR